MAGSLIEDTTLEDAYRRDADAATQKILGDFSTNMARILAPPPVPAPVPDTLGQNLTKPDTLAAGGTEPAPSTSGLVPSLTGLLKGTPFEQYLPKPEPATASAPAPAGAPSGAATAVPSGIPEAGPSLGEQAQQATSTTHRQIDRLTNPAPSSPVALPDHLDTSSREANLRQWAPALNDLQQKTGLRADALWAIIQAENGGGQSPLSAQSNNYFSIQAVDNPHQMSAVDATPGYGLPGRFGRYKTPQDSLDHFVELVSTSPRYAAAWANRNDPQKFFAGLVKGGYIVPEPGFPVDTWLQNLDQGRQYYNQTAPAEQAPTRATPATSTADRGSGGLDVSGIEQAYKDVPYTFGGPGGRGQGLGAQTDCSGFVSAVWKDQYGLSLAPHTDGAYNQLRQAGASEVTAQQAQPGDVVFYMGAGTGGAITHHMGIFAGSGKVLDMSVSGQDGVHLRDVGHAGQYVILRDPRLNAQTPQSASVPPPIQSTGVAEATGGQKLSNRELQAQAQDTQPTMYRQPLQPTPGDAFETEDASTSPGASGAPPWEQQSPPPAVPGAGAFQDDYTQNGQVSPWTQPNARSAATAPAPGAMIPPTSTPVPASQTIPNEDAMSYPRPEYVPPASPLVETPTSRDVPSNVPPTSRDVPPPSPYDAGQQASMEPAANRFQTSEPTATSGVLGTLGEAATATGQAIAGEATAPTGFTTPPLPSLRGLQAVQNITGTPGTVIGRRTGEALGLTDDPILDVGGLKVSPLDVAGFIGQNVLDPTNLISGEGQAANRVATEGARALEQAHPGIIQRIAQSVREHLAGDAERAGQPVAREMANALPGEGPRPVTKATGVAESIPSPLPNTPRDITSANDMVDELRRTDFVPASQVVQAIGDRPEYLGAVAQYMTEQRAKVANGQLTPRDVAKAYYMTVASQGSDAVRVSTIESKVPGFKVPEQFWSAERAADGSPLVRPEEAAAAWLFTPKGQQALDDIERGVFNREAWSEGAGIRRAFGDDRFRTTNVLSERAPVNGRTQFNMESVPAFTERFNQVAQEAAASGNYAALDQLTKRLNGVAEAKLGFIKHALGFGETPTIDAVEINTWLTGQGEIGRLKTKEADLVRTTNTWLRDPRVGAYLRDRILGEFQNIHGMLPPEATADLPPEVFNHVLHHWIWDKMKGTATTHKGFYDAMTSALLPEASALPSAPNTSRGTGPATNAALLAAPGRALAGGATGAVSGGVAGYESSPEGASPGETAARTLAGAGAGALAGVTIAGAGTLAAGRLVDSLVERGAINPRVLATHPKTADRVRALFSVAADGLPDDAPVPVPTMVQAMVRMRPDIAGKVSDLLGAPVTAGQVRQIVGAADSPGVAQTVQELVVDALTGLGARGRRGRELAADAATVRGISDEAARTTRGRTAEVLPALETPNGPARRVDPSTSPNLTSFVDEIADKLGVARPGVYVAPSMAVNAAATTDGKSPALIITRGLLKSGLTDDEMAAVLTHELAHTAQDSRGPVGRAFGAVRDAVGNLTGSGEREMQGALPQDRQLSFESEQARLRAENARETEQPSAAQPRLIPNDPLQQGMTGIAPAGAALLPPSAQRAVQQAKAQQQPGLSPLQWTGKLLGEVGYSSMIGPATFSVNVLGNLMEPLWSIPKEATRAIVRGNPREFVEMAGGAFHGMGQLGTAMVDALASRGRFAATPGHEPLSAVTTNPIGKAITTMLEGGGRVFSALPDAIFGTIATGAGEARTAAQIATDAGLKGQAWKQHVSALLADVDQVKAGQLPSIAGTQDVIDGGAAYAKRQTFQDELGTIGKKARTVATLGDLPVVGHLITPFFNTPWNMNTRMLERTPAGFAMNSQGSRFDRMYDATLGSALLIGLAAGPVAAGTITGGGPNDPQKKAEMRSQGWRPYSTLIDGVYVPNRVFGVYAPLMNAAADVHDSIAYAKDSSPGSITSDYVGRLGQQVQQQPYLQGISNIMQAIQAGQGGGLTSGAENYAASTITRMVPYAATGRFVGTALDPNERTIDRGKNVPASTTIGQQVQSGVGLRGDLPVAQDVLGRPQENPQQGWKAGFAKTSPEKADQIIKAFLDNQVDIGSPRQDLTISLYGPDGKVSQSIPMPLTPAEQRTWNQLRGDALINLVGPATKDPEFAKAPPDVQAKWLQTQLQTANDYATRTIRGQLPDPEITKRIEPLRKAS
jgi:cell wall-associated NlpC family hydrolase